MVTPTESTATPATQASASTALPDEIAEYLMYLLSDSAAGETDYALERLVVEKVVNDTVGETWLVLVAQRGTVQVEGQNRHAGPVSYDSGSEVRAFMRGEHSFSPAPVSDAVLDEHGNTWQVTEDALLGPDGETAPRLRGHLAYWFGWYAFFPKTQLYKLCNTQKQQQGFTERSRIHIPRVIANET